MKFRGFLKKGNIQRKSNEFSISDPGSDDSWDVLCKNDSQINEPPRSKPIKAVNTTVTAATSSKEVGNAPMVHDSPLRNKVVDNLSTTQDKVADTSVASQADSKRKKKKLLPFTSTPFVRHVQIPTFDMSSIISPVDEFSNERLPAKEAENDSGTILVLNRKNSAGAADDTFNQLLNPGKIVKKRSSKDLGVRPLKSLINQGDTTRQYAGGALKAVSSVKPACNSIEDSWETTEASPTCTTELKKTSLSPEKMTRKCQEPDAGSRTVNKDKTTAKSKQPSDTTTLQDENRAQRTAIEGKHQSNSPQKSTRRSQNVVTEIPDVQTKDKEEHLYPTSKDRAALHLEDNRQQGEEAGGSSNHVHSKTTEQPLVHLEKSITNKTVRKSILAPSKKDSSPGLKKRVSFCKASDQANPTPISNSNLEEEGQARGLEPDVQTLTDEKKKTEEEKSELRDKEKNTHALVNQDELHTSNHVEDNVQRHSQKGSEVLSNDVNMVCQSNFAVKIGSTVLTQSSCFGVKVGVPKSKSSENGLEKHALVAPDYTSETVQATSKASVTELGDRRDRSSPVKVMESTEKQIHSSTNKTSSTQQNKPDEIESSSEEERILLRAQSLKLRENQTNSSRNSNSLKITDTGQLGPNSRHNQNSTSPFKSPVKSPASKNQQGLHPSLIGTHETLCLVSQDDKQPQPTKPITLKKTDGNESNSSCDIFISRQPADCQINFEDNFQLEIMSTSEDEGPSKNKNGKEQSQKSKEDSRTESQKLQTEFTQLKQSKKVSRLSSKAKEIRRRRKEKIEEKRKSWGNSSGSDSPSPQPVQKRISRRGKHTPSPGAREIEDVDKCKKRLVLDNIIAEKPDIEKSDDQGGVEALPPMPSIEKPSSQDLESKAKIKISRKNLTPEKGKQKKAKRLRGEPTTKIPDVQLDDDNPATQDEKGSSSNRTENNEKNHPVHDHAPSHRSSHRSRKPPSMYWLPNRDRDDNINDYIREPEKDSSSQPHKKSSYNERKAINLKSQKRKIDKSSKSDKDKTKKRVRQIEQDLPPQSYPSPSHSDEERALVYDTYSVKENDTQNITCMPMEIKTTGFVWGCGMKGELLSLGAGAKCDQRKSTYNQVFYVLEGKINYKCAHEKKILTTGSVFIVPKGETCNIENLNDLTVKLFVTSNST